MPRNVERDELREAQRRHRLIVSGLKLFAENGIESVSLQTVADEAKVGIATLYKYYTNKTNLVIAISAYVWKRVWDEYNERIGAEGVENYNAYQQIEAYYDMIIFIYQNHPEVLRFSGYYKTYINNEAKELAYSNEHLAVLAPINDIFHNLYERAKVDKSIRTDIDEKILFTTQGMTILGMAERYAQGIVWGGHDDGSNDYTKELLVLKDMMLSWIKG